MVTPHRIAGLEPLGPGREGPDLQAPDVDHGLVHASEEIVLDDRAEEAVARRLRLVDGRDPHQLWMYGDAAGGVRRPDAAPPRRAG